MPEMVASHGRAGDAKAKAVFFGVLTLALYSHSIYSNFMVLVAFYDSYCIAGQGFIKYFIKGA